MNEISMFFPPLVSLPSYVLMGFEIVALIYVIKALRIYIKNNK